MSNRLANIFRSSRRRKAVRKSSSKPSRAVLTMRVRGTSTQPADQPKPRRQAKRSRNINHRTQNR